MKLSVISTLSMLCLSARLLAGTYGDLTYEVEGNIVAITDCEPSATGTLIIPPLIENKPVTTIEFSAFRTCTELTVIEIPNTITSIADRAFSDCINLSSINVDSANHNYSSDLGVLYNKSQTTLIRCPKGFTGSYTILSGVITIGTSAFNGCANLVEVTIPGSVTAIEASAFLRCTNLASVTIPSGVEGISIGAFAYCTNLQSVTLPNTITTIESRTFISSDKLTSMTIPSSVTNIDGKPWSNCTQLNKIIFDGNAPTSFNSTAFDNTAPDLTVYFYEGATGFSRPTWNGYPTEELSLSGNDDGDRYPNNLERLLGTNPVDTNSQFKAWLSQDEAGLYLLYSPHSDACEFIVESTTDITDSNSWEAVENLSFSGNTKEQSAILAPNSGNAIFYRISVSEIE